MYNSGRHEKTVPMARSVIANPRGSSCYVLDILLLITGVFAIFGVTFDESHTTHVLEPSLSRAYDVLLERTGTLIESIRSIALPS